MLTVWGRRSSSNVQALMWAIGELALAYNRHDFGGHFGGLDGEEFAVLNPNRTIPVLRDDDGPPLWETGAILRYLGAKFGSALFWPDDLAARTEIDRWAEWAKLNIAENFTVPVFWAAVRTPADEQNPEAISAAVETLEKFLKIAETRLRNHTYLVGDELTLADIQFGHCLFRYFDIAITRADLPALAAYYDRLTQRPAYRDHVMLPYDELRGNLIG